MAKDTDSGQLDLWRRPDGNGGRGEITTWSVTELVQACADLLEGRFPDIWVEGEVSNLSWSAAGHGYFSLKDGSSQVNAVMFRSAARRLTMKPSDGDQVRCRGHVSIYPASGRFQLYVDVLESAGLGKMLADLERLKAKLASEGLFDEENKKPLPPFPKVIGVVTSPTGAAIRDIINVLGRRWPLRIIVSPTIVQGVEAPQQIVTALERIGRFPGVDLVICGRGGGAMEDLWAFNDEVVVRAIAACPVPVISAVGHDVDHTLSDLVADVRAPTPSAAAELAVPDRLDVAAQIAGIGQRMQAVIERGLSERRLRLNLARRRLGDPRRLLDQSRQDLDGLTNRMFSAANRIMRRRRDELAGWRKRLSAVHPLAQLNGRRRDLTAIRQRLLQAWASSVMGPRTTRLASWSGRLTSLSPLAVLDRGYALVTDVQGRPLSDWRRVTPGDRVHAKLAQGRLECMVEVSVPDAEESGTGPVEDEKHE
ncbi:MAG: exodeoxyribonuclease VII large subunit [Deltaproteobacteria bacterium]|nr:exodeoxyribonuclease VII large subunit [Deltaproteobacteria bacterium]